MHLELRLRRYSDCSVLSVLCSCCISITWVSCWRLKQNWR